MKYWYVDQPDKSLSIRITKHPDGSYGIGGYLRLYNVTEDREKGTLISNIHLTGASAVPEAGTGSGSESGISGEDSSILDVQDVIPDHVRQGAEEWLAAQGSESEDTQELLASIAEIERGAPGHVGLRSRQEPGDADSSNQA